MNYMSDTLKSKLPPTDSRLRPDLRLWENANDVDAQAEMSRLVSNQKNRRSKLKEHFKDDPNVNMMDERTFYNPQFFKKEVIEVPDEPT